MPRINYHHLHYFYMVAREGGVARASERLFVTPPTVSAQVRKLEQDLGEKLFLKDGRRLRLTEAGKRVYAYAQEIFALGEEMILALEGTETERPLRFRVGVVDALPKLVAYRLLEPALALGPRLQLVCREGKFEPLLAELATGELDLILSETRVAPPSRIQAFNHHLGACGIGVFGSRKLVAPRRASFPTSLEDAPFLMPTAGTALRDTLDRWLDGQGIRPRTVAEIEDGALIKAFGQAGAGLFAAPSAIEAEVIRQYDVELLGRLAGARERFYAITAERRIQSPAAVAIATAARSELLDETM